jgi:hypothetical protein
MSKIIIACCKDTSKQKPDASAREGSREGAWGHLRTRLVMQTLRRARSTSGGIVGPGLPPRAKYTTKRPGSPQRHQHTTQHKPTHPIRFQRLGSKIRGAGASFISSGRSSEAQKAAPVRLEAASAMP